MNYHYYHPNVYSSYPPNYSSNPSGDTHLHNNMGQSAMPPQFGPGPSQTFQGILQFAGQLETNRQMCFMRIQQLEKDKGILMEQNAKLDQENRELKAKIILHQKIMQQSSSPNSVDRHSLVNHSRESSRNDQLQQQNGSNMATALVPSNPFNVPNPQNAIISHQSVGSTEPSTSTAELPFPAPATVQVLQLTNLVAQMPSNGENQESNPPILDDQTAPNLMSASDDQTISEPIPILSDQRISEDRVSDQQTTSNQEEGPSSSILTVCQEEESDPDQLGFKVPRSDFTCRQTDHSSLSTSDTDLISTSDKFITMDKIIKELNVSTTTKTAITTENVLQPVTEISNCHDQEDDMDDNVGSKTSPLQMIVPIDLSLIKIPVVMDAEVDEALQNANTGNTKSSTPDHDQDVVFEDEICRNKFIPGLMKNEISEENEEQQIEQLEEEEEEEDEKNNIHSKMEVEPEDKREEQEPRMKKAKTEPAEA